MGSLTFNCRTQEGARSPRESADLTGPRGCTPTSTAWALQLPSTHRATCAMGSVFSEHLRA